MPLDRYGVLVGTLAGHKLDRPGREGPWYHVNLHVDAPGGTHRCAIDVDSKQSATGVEWSVLRVGRAAIAAASRKPGFHELERSPHVGAIDLLRHPVIAASCSWTSGTNVEATNALEAILQRGRRILVFGEPFRPGLGMHHVHQNQGDPAGTPWWGENAIWQDGATMTQRPDGDLDVFVSRFSTQAEVTGDDGHPLAVRPA